MDGYEKLQTLCEHVETPNAEPSLKAEYACSSENCPTHKYKIVWNQDGELYSDVYPFDKGIQFIDNNDAPFGTFQRKMNVEARKKDKNFTLLKFWRIRIDVKYQYDADENGKILSRKRKYDIYTRAKGGGWIHYISGLHMFFWVLKEFYRFRKYYLEDSDPSPWTREQVLKQYEGYEWDKRWWRRVSQWYLRWFHRKLYKELKGF